MIIDIMTIFPEIVDSFMKASIIGRAQNKGIVEINCINIRDFCVDKHNKTDDAPYGGGNGMVMLAEPLYMCHQSIVREGSHTILMSPRGVVFNQMIAKNMREKYEHIIIVCGHYEGVDQRFIDLCVDEEISIGDFVLTGGEMPAIVVSDCICRMVPGVLSNELCYEDESHWRGLLEYPHYTRPGVWRGEPVPDILLSGHHANIDTWRYQMSLMVTHNNRPDMIEKLELSSNDRKLLEKFKNKE